MFTKVNLWLKFFLIQLHACHPEFDDHIPSWSTWEYGPKLKGLPKKKSLPGCFLFWHQAGNLPDVHLLRQWVPWIPLDLTGCQGEMEMAVLLLFQQVGWWLVMARDRSIASFSVFYWRSVTSAWILDDILAKMDSYEKWDDMQNKNMCKSIMQGYVICIWMYY